MTSRAATYDMTGLETQVSRLHGMLFGTGATPGQLEQVLKTETGQLAGRMGDAAGPKKKTDALENAENELLGKFRTIPAYSNLEEGQQSSSYPDFKWLYAGSNFVAGIDEAFDLRSASGPEAMRLFRAAQKGPSFGNAWTDLGSRKHQHIMKLNRMRVTKSAFNYMARKISESTGQLKAACYAIARVYIPNKPVKAWIEKKIPVVWGNGKAMLNENLMGTPEATIEFAITSAGIVSNPTLVNRLQGAIEASRQSIAYKLGKIAKGAKYVWETGQTYFEEN